MTNRTGADPPLSKDDLALAEILLDPVKFAAAFMRSLDAPEPNTPLILWPHQQEDVRDNHPQIVHQDGRAVGKTVDITVLVCHEGVTGKNSKTLITTPNEGHLQKIIEEVEDQIFGSDFLNAQVAVDPRSGRQLITRKPYYQIKWKSGVIQYFRPAGSAGAAVRSLHCARVIVDEAAMYPEAAWKAVFRVLNPGAQLRVYTNPNGLRNTQYYRLTQDGSGSKVYKWPSWIVPTWTQADREMAIRRYGGEDSPGYQHEVAGEHGAPSYAAFNHKQYQGCERKLEGRYRCVRIEGEEFVAIQSVDEAWDRLAYRLDLQERPGGTFWLGGDLGYTNDPSELTVWEEDEKGRLIPVLRVHNERLPYTYQAALIAILDDHFAFAGLGIDGGSNGAAVEHILTTEDRYANYQFAHRLVAFDFGGSTTVGYDPEGRPKTRYTKELMTSLISGRLSSRTILFPAEGVDPDWADQFLRQTYSIMPSGRIVYSKGNDHIIDSARTAILRIERERLKQYDTNDQGLVKAEFVMPVMTGKVFE